MPTLDELPLDSLRDYARDLLHSRGDAVADIDRRRQELPYQPLLTQYQGGSRDLRERLGRAVLALLDEAAKETWPLESLHYLLTLVDEIHLEQATEKLKGLVTAKAWLVQPEATNRQMLALRTLLGLGWKGDPNFWLRQHKALEARYPALVFRALAAHDLELAFAHFNTLAPTPEDARQLLRLFPSLLEQHSLKEVRDLTCCSRDQLKPEVAEVFSNWFELRGYGSIRPADPEPLEDPVESRWAVRLAHVRASGFKDWVEVEDNDSWETPAISSYASSAALKAVLQRPQNGSFVPISSELHPAVTA